MASRELNQQIRERARQRCEYCLIPQLPTLPAFHIEHIVAAKHAGQTEESNLALACAECNRTK